MTVTEAVDDYLKAIYELAGDDGRATTALIAKKLDVAPASVTGMLRKLAEQQPPFIDYEKHHGATLTDSGRRRALEIIRHHRLIELFLC
ncbi:MAG: metal-dependent transcriptional regulator, partial [Bryobacterales bacterium]